MGTGMHRQNLPLTLLFVGSIAAVGALFVSTQNQKIQGAEAKKNLREEIVKSSQDQKLEKFSLTGFDEKGKKSWNLEGNVAKIDPGQMVFLDENVTLKLQETTIVKTDHVQWSQGGGELRTNSLVTVDHESVKIKGIGAYGRMSDSYLQLNRTIDMIINQNTKLTCLGPLKIYYKENRMIFYRNVKITDDRGTLTAKRMDVFFSPTEKKVERIIAIGDVLITRGQDTTRSKRAIYTVATGAVRLEGNPEITLHKDSKLIDATLRN